MRPVHPGEILRDEMGGAWYICEFLGEGVARAGNRITAILDGQRGVTADTALRLARYFGTTPQVWMNLQKTWELRRAELEVGREIETHVSLGGLQRSSPEGGGRTG